MSDRDQAILWAREMLTKGFVVLDTETTGLGGGDEAVSIGIVDKTGKILLDTLLRHEKPSDPKAEATHGITWKMTRNAPEMREIAPEIFTHLDGKHQLIYNAEFDTRILRQTFARYGIEAPKGKTETHCVMEWFAQYYGDWNDYYGTYRWQKLTTAAGYFGIPTNGAHGAAADALMTLRVVQAMAASKTSEEAKQ